MADEYPTMLDLAQKAGCDPVTGLIEQNLARYPEALLFPAKTIRGTSYKTLLRTDYPDPGFRLPNEGVETKKSTYVQKLAETFFLDGHLQIDEAIDGADTEEVIDQKVSEADGMMKGILRRLGKQVWYGTGLEDTKGFPGAVQVVDSGLVVDATGTTADTGSSVYLVCFGTDQVTFVFGNGKLLSMPDWTRQRITKDSKHLFAEVTNISGWTGVQWVNQYSVGRIKKLTEDSGKGLTDALIADLIGKFPDEADMSNARLFMTRRSARQLQKSRSVTNAADSGAKRTSTGVELSAPWPTESNGIKIEITSSIRNTEALTL